MIPCCIILSFFLVPIFLFFYFSSLSSFFFSLFFKLGRVCRLESRGPSSCSSKPSCGREERLWYGYQNAWYVRTFIEQNQTSFFIIIIIFILLFLFYYYYFYLCIHMLFNSFMYLFVIAYIYLFICLFVVLDFWDGVAMLNIREDNMW